MRKGGSHHRDFGRRAKRLRQAMDLERITERNFYAAVSHGGCPWHGDYLVMYSSQWKGYTTDPSLMLVPIDDHLVHRGDGVFDVMRCVKGKIYQMEAHLRRLENSAKAISLRFPPEYSEVRSLVTRLTAIGEERECVIRVVLSRGPGSFGPSPFDCPSSQLYINVLRFKGLPDSYYQDGVAVITSRTPAKRPMFARIKSCNYLANVLMKMEALTAGCPYAISVDEEGFLAEGATENVGVVTREGIMKFPEFEKTLSGVTAQRVFDLAQAMVREKRIRAVSFDRIPLQEAHEAREVFLTGTSLNVLPVVRYDDRIIGDGLPGPICMKLSDLLWRDMTENHNLLTEVPWERSC